jgi:formylglycine-generating enzyme required for sulfatase activity
MKSRRPILLGGLALAVVMVALCLAVSIVTAPEVPPAAKPLARAIVQPTERKLTPTAKPLPTPGPTPESLPPAASLGDSWIRPNDGMVMVYVPGGTFERGGDDSDPDAEDDEFPAHSVTLSDFWIDRTEATNAQFARCVEAGACEAPYPPALELHADYYGNEQYASYPVGCPTRRNGRTPPADQRATPTPGATAHRTRSCSTLART